jgi:hypothetical protein
VFCQNLTSLNRDGKAARGDALQGRGEREEGKCERRADSRETRMPAKRARGYTVPAFPDTLTHIYRERHAYTHTRAHDGLCTIPAFPDTLPQEIAESIAFDT